MEIDIKDLIKTTNGLFEDLEKESVSVGIHTELKARNAEPGYGKGRAKRNMPDDEDRMRVLALRRKTPKFSKMKLKDIGKMLDRDKGVFTKIKMNADARDMLDVANLFAVTEKTADDIQDLERACRALVRNPILRKEYGSNSASYVKAKSFDHYGIATGTFYGAIRAQYRGPR